MGVLGLRIMVWMVGLAVMAEVGRCELHYVGGTKYSWAPNVNLSRWSSHQHFYVGDWLYFGFNKLQFNVLEVNKTSCDSCNDKDFIKNITRGGRDVFQLTEARPYYFLSGGGYCFQGMKVTIDVEKAADASAPAPAALNKSGSHSFNLGIWVNPSLMVLPMACIFLFRFYQLPV